MAISIISITRENGATCDHVSAVVNHEGTPRTFKASFGEIDAMFADMSAMEQLRMLVLLWAKYRRSQSRSVTGVTIA